MLSGPRFSANRRLYSGQYVAELIHRLRVNASPPHTELTRTPYFAESLMQDGQVAHPLNNVCVAGDRRNEPGLQPHRGTGERMKKILLGTSAIALAGATAGQAQAASWDLDWGGYFEASVGFASVDAPGNADYDGVDVLQDSEIIFTPSITLDNGLTFGVDVQLEGVQNGDQIDEAFAFVKGSFGQILIGSENSAGYKMTYGAPDKTWINVNSGSLSGFIPFSGGGFGSDVFRGTLGSSYLEVNRNNDAQRITYFTPRFAGFQVGVSYARDAQQDSSSAVNINAPGTLNNIFDIGANYVNSFGAFDIALSGRYGQGSLDLGSSVLTPAVAAVPGTPGSAAVNGLGVRDTGTLQVLSSAQNQATFDANGVNNVVVVPFTPAVAATPGTPGTAAVVAPGASGNPSVYSVGLNLGYAGFSVGGSYAVMDADGVSAADGNFFDVGVAYGTGPWEFSATYARGEDIDNDTATRNATNGLISGPDETLQQVVVGANYKLGKGVKAGVYGGWVDFEGSAPGVELDGFVVGTGFKLNF